VFSTVVDVIIASSRALPPSSPFSPSSGEELTGRRDDDDTTAAAILAAASSAALVAELDVARSVAVSSIIVIICVRKYFSPRANARNAAVDSSLLSHTLPFHDMIARCQV
jgi:hypothetical protein